MNKHLGYRNEPENRELVVQNTTPIHLISIKDEFELVDKMTLSDITLALLQNISGVKRTQTPMHTACIHLT